MNKEPRLRFTDEERADPALEKPIRKAEKAAARADQAQANIPKKKVKQTVIDPDTGKKTSKLTFEDKKKPPSKLSQGVKEAPVHLVAGKLHKEIRETEHQKIFWKQTCGCHFKSKNAHGICWRFAVFVCGCGGEY